ncbi:MAG: AraC family transcriptional regulator [Pseudomonadota bacterium]
MLRSHNVLRTNELDEARAAVSERYCDHRLSLVTGHKARVVHNHVRGARVSLNVLEYGADVAINPGELQDFYLLQLPLAGYAVVHHRGEEVHASSARGTLLNPDRPTEMIWKSDCRKLMVQIDASYLQRVAREEIGSDLPGAVRFDPKVELTSRVGQRLFAASLAAARIFDAGEVPSEAPDLNLLALERQLAVSILETQPSNISHLLAARHACSSTHLRRAIAYIRVSFHNDLTLDDIATAAGVHHRTLQTTFRAQLGVTPIQFLRDVRLDNARFHLSRRRNRASVSDIAYDCGYSHLGRFSRDFRVRFGHPPSETV